MKLAAIVTLALATAGCVSTDSKILKPQPERASEANLKLGIEHLRNGDLAQAKEKIDSAIEWNSRNASAQAAAGLLYDRLGDIDKADNHYGRAVSLDPENPDILNNYASFLCQRSRFARGEKYALEAARNPLYTAREAAFLNAGHCARGAGNLKQAEESYRQALTVQPRFAAALYQLADLKYQQTDYLSARGFLERYLALGRSNPTTLMLGVQIEKHLGNLTAANNYTQRLINEYPQSAETKEVLKSEQRARQ
jgi:type IV pilus assembly protein PilF